MLCVCELVTCEILAVKMKGGKEDKRQDFTRSVFFLGFAVIAFVVLLSDL